MCRQTVQLQELGANSQPPPTSFMVFPLEALRKNCPPPTLTFFLRTPLTIQRRRGKSE